MSRKSGGGAVSINVLLIPAASPRRRPFGGDCARCFGSVMKRIRKFKGSGVCFLTPINGTIFSTPLRGRKTQEIISNLLKKKLTMGDVCVHDMIHKWENTAMKFLSVRDLRGKSAQIWKELPYEREMVVTSNGRPIAILAAITEANLEESLSAFRRSRAVEAVVSLQRKSAEKGTDKISLNEINAEIKSVREKRT